MSDLQNIVDWLYRQDCRTGAMKWDDMLIDAAEQALGKDRIDAERFAAGRNLTLYWNKVLQLIAADKEKERNPLLVVQDPKARTLSWYADHTGIADAKEVARRTCLQCRAGILRKIDALTDREFEALGCVVSEEIGADQVHLTAGGNERGIDFLASFRYLTETHVFSGNRGHLRVVGQSKKYTRKVDRDKVDLLDKAIEKIRNRNPDITPIIPPWFFQTTGPIGGRACRRQRRHGPAITLFASPR